MNLTTSDGETLRAQEVIRDRGSDILVSYASRFRDCQALFATCGTIAPTDDRRARLAEIRHKAGDQLMNLALSSPKHCWDPDASEFRAPGPDGFLPEWTQP